MKQIKDNIRNVVSVLIDEALDGDTTSARALLNYHQAAAKEYVDAPELAQLPVEARHEAIFSAVAEGRVSLDHAERLAVIVASQMRVENTTRFLTFLREIAAGADPVIVARRLAAELTPEAVEEMH